MALAWPIPAPMAAGKRVFRPCLRFGEWKAEHLHAVTKSVTSPPAPGLSRRRSRTADAQRRHVRCADPRGSRSGTLFPAPALVTCETPNREALGRGSDFSKRSADPTGGELVDQVCHAVSGSGQPHRDRHQVGDAAAITERDRAATNLPLRLERSPMAPRQQQARAGVLAGLVR